MSKAFSTKFVLVSDVQFVLPPEDFGGGPWIHLATVVRGFREYMCFKHSKTDHVYIERIDQKDPDLFIEITDNSELDDLTQFLKASGVLSLGIGKEFKIG